MFDTTFLAAVEWDGDPDAAGLMMRDFSAGGWVPYDPSWSPEDVDVVPLEVLLDDGGPHQAAFDDIDPADRAWLLSLDHDDTPTTTHSTTDGDPAAGGLTAPTHDNPPSHGDAAADGDVPTDEPVPVEAVATGPELAAVLAAVDLTEASAYDVVETVAGWARLAAWVTARQAATLAELTTRPELQPGECGYRSVNPVTNTSIEVAARTVTTTRQAENLVGHAVQLVHDFPATWQALQAGLIDERRARVITDELGGQTAAIRSRVEAAVLPDAGTMDTVVLRRRVKELLHELAPVDTAERCQRARQNRYAAVTPASDGMAHLEAFLPAEEAAAVKATLDAAADTMKRRDTETGREPRTADQRRADALAALAWASLSGGYLGGHQPGCPCTCNRASDATAGDAGGGAGDPGVSPTRDAALDADRPARGDGSPLGTPLATAQGRPVTVHVTFPFTSLIGLTDEPGHLDGYGPIPAHIARHLAAAGIWRWVGTDPATGHLLDYGLTKYRPPQALIDYVVMRDRICRSPGCHHPAIRCDIDHRVPHGDSGPTSACNCQPLCRRHHLLKHRGGWRVDQLPSGATIWVSPTGHRYLKPPERIGPTSPNAPPAGTPLDS